VHTHRRLGFWPDRADGYGPDVAARLRLADAVTLEQHLDAHLARRALRATMARAFDRLDVVLTPSAAITAPAIDDCDEPVHDGRRTPIRELTMPFHVVEALCGCPAICLPVGVDERSLPTSVMLSAAPGQDLALLHVAARLEAALGYARYNRPPTTKETR
jgi:Asp-tRNA(Asn)/Glu-tRNA(Gln) amidotransferase A subunit family amidase